MSNAHMLLAFSMVIMWSIGVILLPNITNNVEPCWTAFIRFCPPIPFIFLFSLRYNKDYFLTLKEFLQFSTLSLIFVSQTYLFHLGSVGSSGSRIAIALFTFPVFMPLVCPLVVPNEKFDIRKMYGAICGFVGLTTAILAFQKTEFIGCLRNDLIELVSAVLIAINLAYVKRLAASVNKWKMLTWQFLISSFIFLILGLTTESLPNFAEFTACTWNSIYYHILGVGIFCWMTQQYLVAEYNPATVTTFFCVIPFTSILIEMIQNPGHLTLGLEACGIVFGSLLVGLGIFISTRYE